MTDATRRTAITTTLAAALAAPFVPRRARAARPMKLAYADTANHPLRPILVEFAAEVGRATEGALQIQVYSTGELGSETNILTGLQTGIIDLCAHTTGFMQTVFPPVGALDLPYLFPTAAVAEKVLDGEVGERLFALMPAKGITGLCWGHWGWRPVSTSSKSVPQPADMKGLRIRVQPGQIYAAIYRQLGAVPEAIDLTEVYVALSQHAIDAVELPLISIVANKLYEVLKVVNDTDAVYNAGALLGSKRKLDALPPAQMTALREAARKLSPAWRAGVAQASAKDVEFLKGQGVAIRPVDLPAYRAATRPVYDQFRTPLGPDFVDLLLRQVQAAAT